jgi:homoprotocatechuate degradation regulator HpaR
MALMRAREAVMREFRPRLAADELTEQQWRVLRALNAFEKPLTTRQLSEMTFLLGPSLSRITAHLSERGLVGRAPHPTDQRSNLLYLTDAGTALVSKVATGSEEGYTAIEASFGVDRLELLHELLDQLAAAQTAEES